MLVSVILPTYNCADYLSRTIDSVLGQSYSNLELIVIDDGSTDETADVVKPYINSERFTYIKQKNLGVSVARNTGISQSRGDLLAFIDADDIWYKDKLNLQVRILKEYPSIVGIFSDFDRADENGAIIEYKYIKKTYPLFKMYKLNWRDIFEYEAKYNFADHSGKTRIYNVYHGDIFTKIFLGNFINTCSLILRKSVIEKCGYFNPNRKTQEDYELWLKVAACGHLAYIDDALLFYRKRTSQLTSKENLTEIHQNSLSVLEQVLASNDADKLDKATTALRMWNKHLDYAKNLLSVGDKSGARKNIFKSIGYRSLNPYPYLLLVWSIIPNGLEKLLRKILK